MFAVSPNLIDGSTHNWSTPVRGVDIDNSSSYTLENFRYASNWERLENKACIEAYWQTFMSAHGDLLAVSSNVNATVLVTAIANIYPAILSDWQDRWIGEDYPLQAIPPDEFKNEVLQHAASWVVGPDFYHVQYCLSEPKEERCRVQFSMIILGIVIFCNLIKVLCMILTLRLQRSHSLVTLGDALESFLQNADPTTVGMCLTGKRVFSRIKWETTPREWKELRYRWFSSASRTRWLTCNIL